MHSCKTKNCQAFAFGGCGRPTRRLPPYGSKRGSENGKGPAVEAPWPMPWPRSAPALARRSRLLLWNHQAPAPAPAPAQVLMAVLVTVAAPRHAPRRLQAWLWLQARAGKHERGWWCVENPGSQSSCQSSSSLLSVGDERKRSKDAGLQGKREKEQSDPNNQPSLSPICQ